MKYNIKVIYVLVNGNIKYHYCENNDNGNDIIKDQY